jgi:hypothetical protein
MTAPVLEFIVTEAGFNVAQEALNSGIKAVLSTFALGSGVNYTPDSSMTALNGTILFSDKVTSYSNLPDGSLVVECVADSTIGTFQFGEIGIFTDQGVLFAVCAFPNFLLKYSNNQPGINTSFTFDAYIKMSNSQAVFDITAYHEPEHASGPWSGVLPPLMLSNPKMNYLITELDNKRDTTTLVQRSFGGELQWSIQSNFFAFHDLVAITGLAPDRSYLDISIMDWAKLIPNLDNIQTIVAAASAYNFVLESESNYFRNVASLSIVGNSVRFVFTQPWTSGIIASNQKVRLWVNDSSLLAAIQVHGSTLDTTLLLSPGDIVTWPGSTARVGTVECNGAALSRTAYPELFAAIGTTFGGSGSTFNVPDLRGYFIRGWDHGRGIDSGRGFGSTQADIFGSHTHYTTPWLGNANWSRTAWAPDGLAMLTNEVGGGPQHETYEGGSETRPKNVALMYCIKY